MSDERQQNFDALTRYISAREAEAEARGRDQALAEAVAVCEKVTARWEKFHSVAPSAAYECAELIKALRAHASVPSPGAGETKE